MSAEEKWVAQAEKKLKSLYVLFACVALASIKGIHAEQALRQANRRFENRIRAVENYIKVNGIKQSDLSQEDLLVIQVTHCLLM